MFDLLMSDFPLTVDCWPSTVDGKPIYSVRNALTGFANAAFIACKLTVIKAIIIAAIPAITNIHHDIVTLYA